MIEQGRDDARWVPQLSAQVVAWIYSYNAAAVAGDLLDREGFWNVLDLGNRLPVETSHCLSVPVPYAASRRLPSWKYVTTSDPSGENVPPLTALAPLVSTRGPMDSSRCHKRTAPSELQQNGSHSKRGGDCKSEAQGPCRHPPAPCLGMAARLNELGVKTGRPRSVRGRSRNPSLSLFYLFAAEHIRSRTTSLGPSPCQLSNPRVLFDPDDVRVESRDQCIRALLEIVR